jgi:20S proteasome alpha/beta subunit
MHGRQVHRRGDEVTTIAYRNGVIAADTGQQVGHSRVGRITKIARNDNGDLAGAAGDASYNFAFRRWFTGGESGEPPQAKETDGSFDRGVIFRVAGTIEVFEPSGRFECRADYYAFGSGRPEALGALFAGATAEKAVEAAKEHDAHTFGDIETLSHS